MLNENIKKMRMSKGLSQNELAIKLNVVRQTVSKWERGLSVPDADMLISISDIFEIPVSSLLGDSIQEKEVNELQKVAEKLEVINLQLAKRNKFIRKFIFWSMIFFCVIIFFAFVVLFKTQSPYLNWNYNNPEIAVLGVMFHILEWTFVRVAPVVFVVSVIGIIINRKNFA